VSKEGRASEAGRIIVPAACLMMMLGVGSATAQSGSGPAQTVNTVAGTQAGGAPTAGPLPAQDTAASAGGELKLVVALFRHGVRAPLDGFTDTVAKAHSRIILFASSM
jgi:hypothetical protein